MCALHLMSCENNHYNFTNTKNFNTIRCFKSTSVKTAFDFAYNMSFGNKGKHRDHRSGGTNKRKNGEIFINTFQGKLAEFGIYNEFSKKNITIPYPDLETYDLGIWDKYDFIVNNKKIAVKSTKPFGQLLLLETKDWTYEGEYIPNIDTENSLYDYFILVRIKAYNEDFIKIQDGESLMRNHKLLYSSSIDRCNLEKLIASFKWSYDIPGYITHEELVNAIQNEITIPKNAILGRYTKMDAENYYIQTGDMHDINDIFKLL